MVLETIQLESGSSLVPVHLLEEFDRNSDHVQLIGLMRIVCQATVVAAFSPLSLFFFFFLFHFVGLISTDAFSTFPFRRRLREGEYVSKTTTVKIENEDVALHWNYWENISNQWYKITNKNKKKNCSFQDKIKIVPNAIV